MKFFLILLLIQLATAELGVDERSTVTTDSTKIFPDTFIYYQINHYAGDGVAEEWYPYFQQLFKVWERKTCLDFIRRDKRNRAHQNKRYLYIDIMKEAEHTCQLHYKESGGVFEITSKGGYITLDVPEKSCTNRDLMVEIARAIGLRSEHSRQDRDNYVTIADEASRSEWYNIEYDTDTVGLPYDYESIMQRSLTDKHYGGRETVHVNNPFLAEKIATDAMPSFYDFKAIYKLYHCSRRCEQEGHGRVCRNGGYLNNNSTTPYVLLCGCHCYPGFAGRNCEQIVTKTKYNENQHRWGIYLVGKLSKCRIALIKRFVRSHLVDELVKFLNIPHNISSIVADAAANKLDRILKGEIQHMPYRSIGGAAAGLFANRLLTTFVGRGYYFKENSPVYDKLLNSMKSDMQKALNSTLSEFYWNQLNLDSITTAYIKRDSYYVIGEVFADVIGAEMHGPIGFKIVKSGLETESLIGVCIQNIIHELQTMTHVVKTYYDTEFT